MLAVSGIWAEVVGRREDGVVGVGRGRHFEDAF